MRRTVSSLFWSLVVKSVVNSHRKSLIVGRATKPKNLLDAVMNDKKSFISATWRITCQKQHCKKAQQSQSTLKTYLI